MSGQRSLGALGVRVSTDDARRAARCTGHTSTAANGHHLRRTPCNDTSPPRSRHSRSQHPPLVLVPAGSAYAGSTTTPPLNPAPADYYSCTTNGAGTYCSGQTVQAYGPDPTGLFCGTGTSAFEVLDQAVRVIDAQRWYDRDGNLLKRTRTITFEHARLSSPSGVEVGYVQRDIQTEILDVPGDFASATTYTNASLRTTVPGLGTVLATRGAWCRPRRKPLERSRSSRSHQVPGRRRLGPRRTLRRARGVNSHSGKVLSRPAKDPTRISWAARRVHGSEEATRAHRHDTTDQRALIAGQIAARSAPSAGHSAAIRTPAGHPDHTGAPTDVGITTVEA